MYSTSTTNSSSRRPTGVILLACIALVAIARLRMASEAMWVIAGESLLPALLLIVADRWSNSSRLPSKAILNSAQAAQKIFSTTEFNARRNSIIAITTLAVTVSPWLMQFFLRMLGAGTGWEIVGMSSIGWASLSAALLARSARAQGSAAICSGFLTLAATCSSDAPSAAVFAMLWGVCCLWWLVSNHWQRFERCQTSTSVESLWYRPVTVLAGCAVFALAAWSTAGRFPSPGRLGLEIMPTSGGTSNNDAFARSGVGDGDAVVAAREHAASFGAVDSDIFLDSDQPSLFDLYSETFGEPIRKKVIERTVALSSISEVEQPQKSSESDGSGTSFTTQRGAPKPKEIFRDSLSEAVLFWIGRADMHLAMERFTLFDGIQWSNPAAAHNARQPGDAISMQKIGDGVWFSSKSLWQPTTDSPYVGARGEAIKYAGLQSAKIPTAPGVQAWHLKQVEDPTLFLLSTHDELSMAGRERVPDYTILRFVNRECDLQRIEQLLARQSHSPRNVAPLSTATSTTAGVIAASQLAERVTQSSVTDWQRIQSVISHLDSEFELDGSANFADVDDPLARFINERRGTDAMFATAAAVMLQSLGYRTRFVTGFVTRNENRIGLGQEFAIYPSDTHAWIEVEVGSNQWIPLEPTPGFPKPHYHISWSHWVQTHWMRMAICVSAIVIIGYIVWRNLALLFDWFMSVCVFGLWLASDVQRSRALVWLIDVRCRMIGHRRPKHVPPRQWLSRLGVYDQSTCRPTLDAFFSEADRLCFGTVTMMAPVGRRACYQLWRQLTCRQISRMAGVSSTRARPQRSGTFHSGSRQQQ